MIIAVSGSRTWQDKDFIFETLSKHHQELKFTQLLSGHQVSKSPLGFLHGVDYFCEQWAKENNIEAVLYPASWKTFGRRAGALRNKCLVDESDLLIAFCSTEPSAGTEMTINMMRKKNKPAIVYYRRV